MSARSLHHDADEKTSFDDQIGRHIGTITDEIKAIHPCDAGEQLVMELWLDALNAENSMREHIMEEMPHLLHEFSLNKHSITKDVNPITLDY